MISRTLSSFKRRMKNQINVNSLLLIIVAALVGFVLKKGDEALTEMVQLRVQQSHFGQRMTEIESKIDQMVLRTEFEDQISALRREVETLRGKKP